MAQAGKQLWPAEGRVSGVAKINPASRRNPTVDLVWLLSIDSSSDEWTNTELEPPEEFCFEGGGLGLDFIARFVFSVLSSFFLSCSLL